jgi:anti-sigma regulatory factor (Ser/Thr protein kinase)
VADSERQAIHVEHFRAYPVARTIDVRMAAAAVQQPQLFPGMTTLQRSNVGTIIAELGTNILKYASSGRILLRAIRCGTRRGVEVLAIDEGPGIPDIRQAMKDRFTTGGTLGLGLGGVRRLASTFDLHCPADGGTHARAVCWLDESVAEQPAPAPAAGDAPPRAPAGHAHPDLGLRSVTRNRPALGERLSGDSLVLLEHGTLSFRIVIDGTGHGRIAHDISVAAAAATEQALTERLEAIAAPTDGEPELSSPDLDALMLHVVADVHARIRGSRGAAMGMVAVDRRRRQLHFLGIGNTRLLQLGYKGWEGVSRDGQLGVGFRPPAIQHFAINPGDVVLQTSDGVRTTVLRAMRARRPGASLQLDVVADQLLARTGFDDDVSVLLSECHI